MQLNLDCMREILLEVEKLGLNERLPLKKLHEQLNHYSLDEIIYNTAKLNEADFIKVVSKKYAANSTIVSIIDITYEGHQFLASIRNKSVWEDIKASALAIGSFSIPIIQQIAASYFSSRII